MDKNKVFTCLGLVGLLIATTVISSVLEGWVVTILWGWFITPLFNISAPSILATIGLVFVLRVVIVTRRIDNRSSDNNSTEKWAEFFGGVFARIIEPLIYLAFGWIIHILQVG